MKNFKTILMTFVLLFAQNIVAQCCQNDGCPNVLVNKCKADGSIQGTVFKQPNGTNVKVKPDGNCPVCSHPPFMHTCDANGNQIDYTQCQ